MTTKTFQEQLSGEGINGVPESVIEALLKQDYDSVEALRETSITQEEFERMNISIRWAKKLAAVFGPQESPTATTPPAETEEDPLANLLDFKELNWTRRHVQRLSEKQITHLMDSVLAKGDGWDFLTWAEREYGYKLAVKRAGAFAADATADLVAKLKQDKYPVQSGIFTYNDEDLVVISVQEIGQSSEKNRRDVFVPHGTVDDSGNSSLMQLHLYENGTGKPVVDQGLLQMLDIAWLHEFKTNPMMPMGVATMLSMNNSLTARDMKGMFPTSYADWVKRVQGESDKKLPDLVGPEGENRLPFGQGGDKTHVDTAELQRMLNEITQNLPIREWQHAVDLFGTKWEIYMMRDDLKYIMRFSRTGIRDQAFDLTLDLDYLERYFNGDPRWNVTTAEFINALYNALKSTWVPATEIPPSGISVQRVREFLANHFSESELNNLCFDLSIPWEEVKRAAVSQTIIEIIGYTQRNGRLPALVARMQELRPRISF